MGSHTYGMPTFTETITEELRSSFKGTTYHIAKKDDIHVYMERASSPKSKQGAEMIGGVERGAKRVAHSSPLTTVC